MNKKNNLGGRNTKMHESILATASGGMAIALATILSFLILVRMPQGGTLTAASMLPVIFCALAFGPLWGIGIGAVHGLLQFAIAPYIAHWASVILDYPLAFAMLGLAGFFAAPAARRQEKRNVLYRITLISPARMLLAVWIAMGGRMLSHLISGVVFFRSYAVEAGQNPWIYSVLYNGAYMLPEAILTSIILLATAAVLRRHTAG